MAQFYDDAGNVVDGVLSPDEAKALQEKAQKAEVLEKQMQDKEEVLKKLQEKDFNFAAYRQKTKAEQDEMIKDWSGKEKALLSEMENLRVEISTKNQASMEEAREKFLKHYVGSDEELRKKVESAEKEFAGEPRTIAELEKRIINAYTLTAGNRPQVNPLNAFYPASDQGKPVEKGERFSDTPEGKALLQQKFGKVIEQAKKRNPNLQI